MIPGFKTIEKKMSVFPQYLKLFFKVIKYLLYKYVTSIDFSRLKLEDFLLSKMKDFL